MSEGFAAVPRRGREFTFYLTRTMHLLESASSWGFFLMCLATFLYAAGCMQYFSQTTMGRIVMVMRFLGFTAVGLNLAALVSIVSWGIRTRHFPWWRILFNLFCMGAGLLMSLGAVFIEVLTHPVLS